MGVEQPNLLVTDESGKEAVPGFSPPHPDTGQAGGGARDETAAPWRRPASLRARPSQRSVRFVPVPTVSFISHIRILN